MITAKGDADPKAISGNVQDSDAPVQGPQGANVADDR